MDVPASAVDVRVEVHLPGSTLRSRFTPSTTSIAATRARARGRRGGISAWSRYGDGDGDQRGGVPSPERARARSATGPALAHDRRHGGQVIDVERVAQAEDEAEAESGERDVDMIMLRSVTGPPPEGETGERDDGGLATGM